MSEQLTSHVRYPADLFKLQRAILQTYHVDDAGTFYSGDDAWATPEDPTQTSGVAQPPYYLTMQMPDADAPSFSIYSTYIPAQQATDTGHSVLTGFRAARVLADCADAACGRPVVLDLPGLHPGEAGHRHRPGRAHGLPRGERRPGGGLRQAHAADPADAGHRAGPGPGAVELQLERHGGHRAQPAQPAGQQGDARQPADGSRRRGSALRAAGVRRLHG